MTRPCTSLNWYEPGASGMEPAGGRCTTSLGCRIAHAFDYFLRQDLPIGVRRGCPLPASDAHDAWGSADWSTVTDASLSRPDPAPDPRSASARPCGAALRLAVVTSLAVGFVLLVQVFLA